MAGVFCAQLFDFAGGEGGMQKGRGRRRGSLAGFGVCSSASELFMICSLTIFVWRSCRPTQGKSGLNLIELSVQGQ